MPMYAFKCNVCGDEVVEHLTFKQHDEHLSQGLISCANFDCYGVYEQILSFSFHRGMQEHYNPSVGKPISSRSQFKSELSRASDEASARTGVTHNYQPIDPRDPAAAGVTSEGTESTYDRRVKSGLIEPKRYV